jgi:tRNA pseudouridine38-40 synthase
LNNQVNIQIKEYTPNCEIKEGMQLPVGVHRYALIIEYNGSVFQGFQKQSNTDQTVQIFLENAISKVADRSVTVICAGRTDSGVHAVRQVVHFDVDIERTTKAWVQGVNTKLPNDIRVHFSREVPGSFHARFSALSRTYRYVIYSGKIRPANLGNNVTWSRYSFNVDAMQQAAQYLVGERDFTSFRAAQCQSSTPMRNIEYVQFTQNGAFIIMEIKANAFLQHMVRNIAGLWCSLCVAATKGT